MCPQFITSLLPEADLAIAEAAARLVPRARTTSDDADPGDQSEPDDTAESGRSPCRMVPGSPASFRGLATRPLTQTAPDGESEAE